MSAKLKAVQKIQDLSVEELIKALENVRYSIYTQFENSDWCMWNRF